MRETNSGGTERDKHCIRNVLRVMCKCIIQHQQTECESARTEKGFAIMLQGRFCVHERQIYLALCCARKEDDFIFKVICFTLLFKA